MTAHIKRQGEILKKALPTIGEWVYRRFGKKQHKPTKLGGPEQLDDFIENGYVGCMDDYLRAGKWRLVKKIDVVSYDSRIGEGRGVIMVEINIGVDV